MTLIWKTEAEIKPSRLAIGSARHRATALEMRRHPNRWAELPMPASYAKYIRDGVVAAYRPAGHFEAMVRDGRVLARYVGPDRGEEALVLPTEAEDLRVKYDHVGLRRELLEKVLAGDVPLSYRDWPKSYGTRIKNGGLGYGPAGSYQTRWTRRMGLEVALVASDGIYGQLAEKNGFPATAAEAAPAAEALARPSTSAEAAAAAVAAVAAGVEPDDSDWSEEDYAAYEAAMWADAPDTEQAEEQE